MKKTFYEFFAGGGMAHAGLGQDWECLFANDFSEKKAASYAANWGDDIFHVGDVALLESAQLPSQADLAWASFPCQDLSLAGNGAGLEGVRSGTFWAFMRLMDGLRAQGRKPRMIALENVYGAITSHAGKDFEAMIQTVATQGYRLGAMVIDAIHFLPQSRPRLFIVAVDVSLQIPDVCFQETPNPAWHPAAIIRAYNQLPKEIKNQWVWWNPPMPKASQKTLDDIIEAVPQGVEWHSEGETERLMNMMSPVNRRKIIQAQQSGRLKVGALYRRTRNGEQRAEVRFDGVSGCIRTPGGGSSRQTIMIVNGSDIRSRLLTAREAARLMGLDDSYRLPDRYNDAYHLAGDGVVVPVVSHLTKHIFSAVVDVNRTVLPFATAA
jgi:DNA (cytosine-5)-methyltransferase 1